MKKATKILLVLAAVVAMTIGAVSTVMAADDYATITEWVEVKNVGWQAKDAEGETIVRGWAQKDGFWYFFDSSYMLVNTFITWNEEIYYLDGNGHMAIGWIGFDADAKDTKYDTEINTVDKYEKKKYANIGEIDSYDFNGAFEIADYDAVGNDLFVDALVAKTPNAVLWCYFNADGTMAQHEWYNAWGLWYFSYGAYAVLGDYQVAIELNNSDQTDNKKFLVEDGEGFYGFAADGHMLVGWEKYVVTEGTLTNGTLTDDDTPYEDKGADKDGRKSTDFWTYYHTNGRQVNTTAADPKNPNSAKYNDDIYEGWELIDNNWTYFIEDKDVLGMVLLQNDFIYDDFTDNGGKLDPNGNKGTFYVDANGYLVRGLKTFAKDATIGTWDEANTSASAIKFAAANATFLFGQESGNMLYGIQDRFYFLTREGEADYVYEVIQKGDNGNVAKEGASTFDMVAFTKVKEGNTDATTYIEGQRLDGKNFFVVVDEVALDIDWNADKKKESVFIYYFESGKMQKNQAIKFGSVTIAIDANGCVVTAAKDNKVTVAGHTFELAGAADNQIILNNAGAEVVIPGLKK
jgi:hypothetical protein